MSAPDASPRGGAAPGPDLAATPAPVALAADHAGFGLKEDLKGWLGKAGVATLDLGTDGATPVDYPDFGDRVARAILEGEAAQGVAVCGTGIGIGIAANRHPGIRAATCHDEETARLARAHNDANVLALGGRILDPATARACLRAFLTTPFEGERHARRVGKLG